MGYVPLKIELMEQIAERLEEWAKMRPNDKVILAAGYFYSLTHPLEKFDDVLRNLQFSNIELSKSAKGTRDRLLQLAEKADYRHRTKDAMEELSILAVKGQAKYLAKVLRDVAQMVRETFSREKSSNETQVLNKNRPWVDDASEYTSNSEAVELAAFANRKLSLSKLSKLLAPNGPINLTMSRYTHIFRGQESEAVAKMPNLGLLSKEKQNAITTGTEGKNDLAPNLAPKGGKP